MAHGLIGCYSAWKPKSNAPPNAEAMADVNEATHESVYMGGNSCKEMQMASDEKVAQKRNTVWLQTLQHLYVQKWLSLCIP